MTDGTFELRVLHHELGDLRGIGGSRLAIERQNLRVDGDRPGDWPGASWVSRPGVPFAALRPDLLLGWDLEVGNVVEAVRPTLDAVLPAVLEREVAHEVADLVMALSKSPMPWHAPWIAPVTDRLQDEEVAWFDVMAPSVNWRHRDMSADPVVFFRRARLVWGPSWCLTAWGPREGGDAAAYRTWGLPDRWGLAAGDVQWSGTELLARQLQAITGHIEWAVGMVDLELEDWENHFMDEASREGLFTGTDVDRLQRHLARLGSGIAQNRESVRTLQRRSQVQPGFPGAVRPDLLARCDEMMEHSHRQRSAVRDSFELVASATSGQQFQLAQDRAQSDGAFQAVVGILAAVFIAPGLIAAFYGANIRGLPGSNEVTGLWFMLGGSVLAALTSLTVIVVVRRHSRRHMRDTG